MTFLVGMQVLIIDLRQCRGGDPGMIALISTYLFGEERVHLNSLYWRAEDSIQQYWTLPYVPGQRFGDKPLYVLTSKATFSGGEEFAYNLKTRQRATIVGEVTGGGAHPGSLYRLHPHFEAFIPIGRAINPITNTNWEACGVTPDILTTSEQAFPTAYRMALQTILEYPNEAASIPLELLKAEALEASSALSTPPSESGRI
jgi:C-terminal processing protease CtpA/Prc